MMRTQFWMAAGLALALAACGQETDSSSYADYEQAASPAPPPMASRQRAYDEAGQVDLMPVEEKVEQGGGGPGQNGNPGAETGARQIAYTYTYGFKVPTGNLEHFQNSHKIACEAAGPAICYIEQSNINGLGEDYASGYMRIRASTDWIEKFREGIPASLEPFNADLDSSDSTAEDLTSTILDTTAMLNSRKTLRDRLQQLLADRPGKLADLLEIERELARVQQQIDSTESILAAMKQRVSMSVLTLNYSAKYSAVSESIWRPLGAAFDDFLGNVVGSIAWLVNFVSEILVLLLVIGGIIWFGLWRWSKRGRKKTAAAPAASGPVTPKV